MDKYRTKGGQSQMVKRKIVSDKGDYHTEIKRLWLYMVDVAFQRFLIQTFNITVRKQRKKDKGKEGMAALSLRGGAAILQKKKQWPGKIR